MECSIAKFIYSLNKYKFNTCMIHDLKPSENQSHILFIFTQFLEKWLCLKERDQQDSKDKDWMGVESG